MTFSKRIFLLFIGIQIAIVGAIMFILDLNIYNHYQKDYSLVELLKIVTSQTSFYLIMVGFILIIMVVYYPKTKK
ncbi:hypothetical protein LC087_09820 [Bacillus carboniphilus]|uniref:Uncharacterized protein n=1 Tax=Bacillus carboniphilus TaxID=86663 RepID=A0ABY9JPA8_9BACI|nr:hypothetical protein [Bacillus carboniphilus]WLR41239.1 hypothetical protein LC087_09820 [Bacillus carboniphilus]